MARSRVARRRTRLASKDLGVVGIVLFAGVAAFSAALLSGASLGMLATLALLGSGLVSVHLVLVQLRRRHAALARDVADVRGAQIEELTGRRGRSPAPPVPPPAPVPSTRDSDVERARRSGLTRFASFALQTRSDRAMDVLAATASRATLTMHDLQALVRAAEAAPGSLLDQGLRALTSRFPLVTIARVLAERSRSTEDMLDAACVLEIVRRYYGDDAIDESDRSLLVEAYFDAAQYRRAAQALDRVDLDVMAPLQAYLLRANLKNPWTRPSKEGTTASLEAWLAYVNAALAIGALEPVSLGSGGLTPLDRLEVRTPTVLDGPLVSVIMPTHDPGPELATAVRSVLRQTWHNVELLVVDDGSTEGRDELDALSESDARVRVVRLDGNVGTYAARNRGLSEARGEFVTVHDDDDWSHPRKIERQARHLHEHPEHVGCLSLHARVSESLVFVRINHAPGFSQPNFSSLMFRRERVLQDAGYWDISRRSADAEFRHRLERVFACEVPVVGCAPTSFTRWGVPSLTSTDLWRGYVDDRRRLYAWSYRAWHDAGPERVDAGARPACPLPAAFDSAGVRPEYDVIFAADMRSESHTLTMQEMEAESRVAIDHGLTVGLLHVNSPEQLALPMLGSVPQALASRGADLLGFGDEVACSVLVVKDAVAAQFLDRTHAKTRVGRLVLAAGSPIPSPPGGRLEYDPYACVASLRTAFGVEPLVMADSPVGQDQLRTLLPAGDIADQEWRAPLVASRQWVSREVGRRAPVIGRDSSGRPDDWPADAADFRRVYGRHALRVLGDASAVIERYGEHTLDTWQIQARGTASVWDFVRELDFWVYYPHRGCEQTLAIGPVAAMINGCLVVLPPELSDVFGPGALYAVPSDVPRLIDEVWRDPERYLNRARVARDLAELRFGESQFVSTLRGLAPAVEPSPSSLPNRTPLSLYSDAKSREERS